MLKFMQNPTEPQRFAFLLAPRFSLLCLANAVEPLRAANMLSGQRLYDWRLLSADGQAVVSSSGLMMQVAGALEATQDALMVLSSYDYQRWATPELTQALGRAARGAALVGGLDTGAWALAAAGLLEGRRATIHWQERSLFEERFLGVRVQPDRYVIDGRWLTAGGGTAALDLMLDLIGQRAGEGLRLEVAALFLHEARARTEQHQHPLVLPAAAKALAPVIRQMQHHLEDPLPIPVLAAQAGLHPRDLERRFRRALGTTPHSYYRHLRLAQARGLLTETNLSVSEVATRCGFASPVALTRALRLHFGQTPRLLRKS